MGEQKAISILYDAIEVANQSKQFKNASIKASIEINAINNTVNILNKDEIIMSVKAKNISSAYTEIIKWLLIAGVPIFNDMHIHITDGEIVVEAK